MKTFSRIMFLAVGFSILAVAIIALSSHPVAAAPPATRIVSGIPPVANLAMQPVSAPGGGMGTQPFATLVNATVDEGSPVAFASFTVPDGYRLVIEFMGGNVCLPVGQKAIFQVVLQTGLQQVDFVLPATAQGTFNAFGGGPCDNFAIGQPMRLYAEPNSIVQLGLARSDTTGSTFLGLAVSGYLVKVH
jgi:hypothetical protein